MRERYYVVVHCRNQIPIGLAARTTGKSVRNVSVMDVGTHKSTGTVSHIIICTKYVADAYCMTASDGEFLVADLLRDFSK